MKLTAILLTAACLQLAARTTGQTVSLNMRNAPVQKVFKEVSRQTGMSILYNEAILDGLPKVTIRVSNAPVAEVLDKCLEDNVFDYSIEGNTILVRRRPAPRTPAVVGVNTNNVLPPPIDIRGRIVNEAGEPVIASVMVKGTKIGTTTNSNGEFQLTGIDEDAVLVITGVSIEPMEIAVAKNPGLKSGGGLTIIAKTEITTLNEVVINKGYYTEKQRETVGNVAVVTSKDIEKQPVQNPLLALQGRVPGLVVTQTTGINGGAVQVRIQGQNSFNSGLEPLIVIDGVTHPSQFSQTVMENITKGGSPLNYINMSDIESISVLKDADATAIYGSRAANGAILITTKKARAGKTKFSFELQQGWGKVTRRADMMNTRQYLDMRYEALKNDRLFPNSNADYDLTVWDTTRYTDWQKELIGGTAKCTNMNVGISGGTTSIQYLVAANFNRQATVFPSDYANKAGGLHFSLNGASPDQRLRVQLQGSYSYNENSLPYFDLTQYAVLLEPNAPKLFNIDGSLNWELNANGSSTWFNPLANTIYTEYKNSTKNLVTSMNIAYTILPGLVLSSNLGYNDLKSDLFNGFKLESYPPDFRPYFQRSAAFGKRNIGSWIIEPQLRFERNIGKGRVEATMGSTIQKSTGNYLQVNASGQPTDELLHSLAAATSITSGASGNFLDYITKFNGLFGRIGYNWDKKYLVNLTGRRDGSSKFGAKNRFHNFWSAGAGWIFSEEKFLQSSRSWLSFGKLRASYGTTGNDQIADYSYLSSYNIVSTDIMYQGTTSFNVGSLSNPFLQWEETRKLQGGIDISAFSERITLGVTYARNRSSNQLITYSLPSITGFTGFYKNFPATIQNTSWEFTLNTNNLKERNFNWSTNCNLTIPHNEVISFPGIELTSYASGRNGVIVGEPIGVRKLYRYGGIDPATGKYLVIDAKGNPTSSPNILTDQTILYSALPKYYGGLSNSISYKGFQLDFLFQFVYQMGANDMYYSNANMPPGSFNSGYSNQPSSVLNRWQKPGDNTMIGRYNSNFSLTIWPYFYSDKGYSYAAGSYIRLKNASLSWQLPDAWSKKAHLQTARFYFRGQNLATITRYKGLDPETRSVSTLPPLQMWTVGAKIEL